EPADETQTMMQILRARTLRGLPPDTYLVPYASLGDALETHARRTPQRPFLIFLDDDGGRAAYSYAEFDHLVNRMANLLVSRYGVRRGERIATLAYNHPDTLLVYFACWKIGATVAPQNASEDDHRIRFILENAAARLLFAMPAYAERAAQLHRDIVLLDSELQQQLAQQSAEFTPGDPPDLEDECLLVYTSGTTGAPKGVQLIQYNLLCDAHAICEWQAIDADQRLMTILPIHHVNGIEMTTIAPLYAGASTVLNRSFRSGSFWQRMAAEQVTIVSVVPTILQFLCEAAADISGLDLQRFRHFVCGAGTLAVSLVERFEQQFGVRILHGYGLSETTCYSCFLPIDLDAATHHEWLTAHGYPSIGVPISINEMAIHDSEGREVAEGERGEIVIRGHNVMIGYFQRPDANAEAFRYGWFRSGDEGFMRRDLHGRPFFFITGRLKELINRGGVKYSPFEIEEVLMRIDGVRTGLAIAFDNIYYGEEVGAYIVREAGATIGESEVLAACRAVMPFAKCPKVVVFGDDIPVTTTGKYQRLRLKGLFRAWQQTQFRE
ncbi:MAG TPA: class I adenylate-forming enzyme family protein, partial [Roseiflexaceae bacterium]|nr:class I adenylate-forming enzyme family protein [Roseiflexaceae bacterium]